MGLFGKPKISEHDVSFAMDHWPDLGQAVSDILTEAGYSDDDIARLAAEAVVLRPEDRNNAWSGTFAMCVTFILERLHLVLTKTKGSRTADAALDAWNSDGYEALLRFLVGELGRTKTAGYGQAVSEDLARNRPQMAGAVQASFPH